MGKNWNGIKKNLMHSFVKEEMLKAVLKIIDKEGVQNLTMDKVSDEVGVAKGTLYLYFENKQDLIEAAIHSSIEPLLDGLFKILDGKTTPDKKLEKMLQFNKSFFQEHQDYFKILLYEHQKERSQKKRYRDNKYQTLLKKISVVIQEGMDQGIFKKADAKTVAVILLESMIGITHLHLSDNPKKYSDRQILIDVFFNGIKK